MNSNITAALLLVIGIAILVIALFYWKRLNDWVWSYLDKAADAGPIYGGVAAGLFFLAMFAFGYWAQRYTASRPVRNILGAVILPGAWISQIIAQVISLSSVQVSVVAALSGAIFWGGVFYFLIKLREKGEKG
jgi:hypothetical protein